MPGHEIRDRVAVGNPKSDVVESLRPHRRDDTYRTQGYRERELLPAKARCSWALVIRERPLTPLRLASL